MLKNKNGHYVVEFLEEPRDMLEISNVGSGNIHVLEGRISLDDFNEIAVNHYFVHTPVDWCGLVYRVSLGYQNDQGSARITIQRQIMETDLATIGHPIDYLYQLEYVNTLLRSEVAKLESSTVEEEAVVGFDPIMSLEV